MEWIDQLKVNTEPQQQAAQREDVSGTVAQLRDAAFRWDKRSGSFADGKASTCRSIADSVERFGGFASDKQREYALKLIAWSQPRGAVEIKPEPVFTVPKLFDVMQRHAHLHVSPLKLSRKNQDSLVWVMFSGQCVGKIENAVVTLFSKRLRDNAEQNVRDLLAEFEADPLEAARKFGKLAGRCCSCGRELTDPVSIERGIGPTCEARFS